ncbi:MAG: hypothetical protein WD688_12730 [Candidatus Binatia bacterium]
MKEPTIEELTTEAMQLLPMGIEDLYMILGSQLLVSARPTRVAGIMTYLSAARKAKEAKELYTDLPATPTASDWNHGLETIHNELIQDGARFLSEVKEDLRKGLCNEDIFTLSEKIDRSSMQIVVMVIGAVLKMPPQLENISATLAAILYKMGLREFCR